MSAVFAVKMSMHLWVDLKTMASGQATIANMMAATVYFSISVTDSNLVRWVWTLSACKRVLSWISWAEEAFTRDAAASWVLRRLISLRAWRSGSLDGRYDGDRIVSIFITSLSVPEVKLALSEMYSSPPECQESVFGRENTYGGHRFARLGVGKIVTVAVYSDGLRHVFVLQPWCNILAFWLT